MITPVSIKVRIVKIPLRKPFIISTGRMDSRDIVIIEMKDKSGAVGYGEAPVLNLPIYKPEYPGTIVAVLKEIIGPAIFNKSFATPAELDDSLNFIRGYQFAKAAVSMAAYDIYGKMQNKTLQQLLSGTKDTIIWSQTVSVYPDPKQALEEAQGYVHDHDVSLIKLKIKPGCDIEYVRIIRENLPDRQLMVDANASYAYNDETVALYKKLDGMGLLCIEQPLAHDDLAFHARLQAQLKTSIALDESVDTVSHLAQAIELRSCRGVNIKIPRVGGLTQAMRIYDLALANNIPVWVGGMIESPISTMCNIAFATKEGCSWPADFMETFTLLEGSDEMIGTRPFETSGCKLMPHFTKPGLGIEINQHVLDRYTVRSESI